MVNFDTTLFKTRFMLASGKIYTLAMFLFFIGMSACNNQHKYDIETNDKYEKGKESIAETEQKNPARFLIVNGIKKKNLLGQTVVKGVIFNNAKIVFYKDVEIKLSFYSKTGTLLEEDHEVIYETINPGGRKGFKSKYFAPKGTDSVGFKIAGAKF